VKNKLMLHVEIDFEELANLKGRSHRRKKIEWTT
jgi:hypothetical protein